MKDLKDEIELRYKEFSQKWSTELQLVMAQLAGSNSVFSESYLRLVSLNMWRSDLLSQVISQKSLAFFLEGQNDALVSHVFAQMGAWRSASKSLRSCLENVVFAMYFKDHPIELTLWEQGNYKPSFSGTIEYLQRHPALQSLPKELTGLEIFVQEYSTLSKAVHGSSSFNMTSSTGTTSLWTANAASVGKWRSRETPVILAVNLLLMAMFKEELQGTKRAQLRSAISFVVPNAKHAAVKASLGIVLNPAP